MLKCPPDKTDFTHSHMHMLNLVCNAREVFFLGRVHVISTGPISTVQTEVRRYAAF
ncbi:unnamed protein product [Staurois parvus]|uniref:Uncharacterized protein n=1 Tax=Staurois parvus TaxID=386267 RepID=A0ABN9G5B7_9NEOB|nr:unnamed protein product [Staurois parvus]